MSDIFPERLVPTVGVTAADRQQDRRDSESRSRRRPSPPAPRADDDAAAEDAAAEPKHELDRLA